MKKITQWVVGVLLLLTSLQIAAQTQRNDLLVQRTYKVYFGQNFIETVSFDRSKVAQLLGSSGTYRYVQLFGTTPTIDGNLANQMIAAVNNNNVNGLNSGMYPSIREFNQSSPLQLSTVFAHRHLGFPGAYWHVAIKNLSTGAWFVAAIAHTPSTPVSHYSPSGQKLDIDSDRLKVSPGHQNVNALSYHTQSPNFSPAPSSGGGNHKFWSNFGGGTLYESSASNNLPIPYSSNTSRTITLDSYQVLSTSGGFSDVRLNLSGGGGKYEVFVPSQAEYIQLPMMPNTSIALQYWKYFGTDNLNATAVTVRIPANQTTAVRVRSAYDYDNYPGLGNVSYDHFDWVATADFVNKVNAMGNNSGFYNEFQINTGTNVCTQIGDGTILGTWNISIPQYTGYPQLKARILNGQLWVTQVIPTNNPNIPEGYGKEDAFVVRGKNMLGRSDVTCNFGSGASACFAGEETGYGGLAIPSAAYWFNPVPAGYQYAVSGDGTPYYFKNAGPCSTLYDGKPVGTWNISIPNYPGYPELKARYINGSYWLTQVVPTNVPAIPEGYGKADAFVVRARNMLYRSDVTNNLGTSIIGCFYNEETAYGGLVAPSAAAPYNPMPAGYTYQMAGDGITPYYSKASNKMAPFQAEGELETDLKVYPNPTDGKVFIEFGHADAQTVTLTIANLQGKTVKHQTALVQGSTEISLEELPAGTYLLVVQEGETRYSLLLNKQ